MDEEPYLSIRRIVDKLVPGLVDDSLSRNAINSQTNPSLPVLNWLHRGQIVLRNRDDSADKGVLAKVYDGLKRAGYLLTIEPTILTPSAGLIYDFRDYHGEGEMIFRIGSEEHVIRKLQLWDRVTVGFYAVF